MRQRQTWAGAAILVVLLAGATWWLAPTRQQAKNPLSSLVRDAIDRQPIRGRVQERLEAGSYSYLALRTDSDTELWTVTMGQGAPKGARVIVRSMGHSENFYSRRLARRFPQLVFGIVSRVD